MFARWFKSNSPMKAVVLLVFIALCACVNGLELCAKAKGSKTSATLKLRYYDNRSNSDHLYECELSGLNSSNGFECCEDDTASATSTNKNAMEVEMTSDKKDGFKLTALEVRDHSQSFSVTEFSGFNAEITFSNGMRTCSGCNWIKMDKNSGEKCTHIRTDASGDVFCKSNYS